ncbi:MAG TPA: hypothetical protein VN766_10550 [Stellaceae bacterium]|jgi:hypothetical protein|nr:hypothetical protein [Stellaceae bacterium]
MTDRDERANPGTEFERSDMNVAAVALIAIVTLLYVCLAPFILTGLYPSALSDVGRVLHIKPPAPVLQLDPQADLQDFRAKEKTRLDSYGWVDRGGGIAHIPIDAAMKDLAARGIPDFGKAQP